MTLLIKIHNFFHTLYYGFIMEEFIIPFIVIPILKRKGYTVITSGNELSFSKIIRVYDYYPNKILSIFNTIKYFKNPKFEKINLSKVNIIYFRNRSSKYYYLYYINDKLFYSLIVSYLYNEDLYNLNKKIKKFK